MDSLGVIDVPGGTVLVTASLYDSRLLGVIELSGDMALYLQRPRRPVLPAVDRRLPPGLPPALASSRRPSRTCARCAPRSTLGSAVSATLTVVLRGHVEQRPVRRRVRHRRRPSSSCSSTTPPAAGSTSTSCSSSTRSGSSPTSPPAAASAPATRSCSAIDLEVAPRGPGALVRELSRARSSSSSSTSSSTSRSAAHALPDAPESADVLELMDAELDLPAAWSVETPSGASAGLVLRDDQATSLLRPDSRIVVRQTVAPLDRDLDAYGNCTPESSAGSASPGSGLRDDAGAALSGVDPRGRAGLVRAEPVQRDARRAAAVGPQLRAMDAGVSFGAEGVLVPDRRARSGARARGPRDRSCGSRRPATSRVRRLGVDV